MNQLGGQSTSAGRSGFGTSLLMGFSLSFAGMVAAQTNAGGGQHLPRLGTSAGAPIEVLSRRGIFGVRALRTSTGLTLEHIARLLGVTRRSIHLWEKGQLISKANEEAIEKAVNLVDAFGDADPSALHEALVFPIGRGQLVLDLVVREPTRALLMTRQIAAARTVRLPTLSNEARIMRAPLDPVALLSSEPAHPVGRVTTKRIARVVRNRDRA